MLDRDTPQQACRDSTRALIGLARQLPRALLSVAALSTLALPVAGAPTVQAATPHTGVTTAQAIPLLPNGSEDVADHNQWMADLAGSIGPLRLNEVILPASHDSATYAFKTGVATGPAPVTYATNQDIDIYSQLQHGVRVVDLRGRLTTDSSGAKDYMVYHGPDTTSLKLATVLDDVARWVLEPGHAKEVVIVQASTEGDPTPQSAELCNNFKQKVGGLLLTPTTFVETLTVAQQNAALSLATKPGTTPPPVPTFSNLGPDLARNTLNDVWSLPNHQRLILNWDGCGPSWPTGTWNGYWANQCYAQDYSTAASKRPGVIASVSSALNGRLSNLGSDGTDGGAGPIATRPSTMPANAPGATTAATGGTVRPGTYTYAYSWLSPLGETQTSPTGQLVVPAGTNTNTITISLPPLPVGATGTAIYMSPDGSGKLTQQGHTDSTTYTQTAPPNTTGQTPTSSNQIGFTRDQFGRPTTNGFYTLGMHATIIAPDCLLPMEWFVPQQKMVLDTVKGWFDGDQNNARSYLNIISCDYVERSDLMNYVLQMNTPKHD